MKQQQLENVLIEVMTWIYDWDPVFTNGDDWGETEERVRQVLGSRYEEIFKWTPLHIIKVISGANEVWIADVKDFTFENGVLSVKTAQGAEYKILCDEIEVLSANTFKKP